MDGLGALLGLGGGIFLVPALTLIFGLPIRTTVGTSLVAVIATSAGVAAVAPAGRGADVSLALRLEVATAVGALAGGLAAGCAYVVRLRSGFARAEFPSAASDALKRAVRAELMLLFSRAGVAGRAV